MFDPELLKTLASMGVGGLLAGVIFHIYRKDALAWQQAWKGKSEMLVQVVKENTAAITALSERIEREDNKRADRRAPGHSDDYDGPERRRTRGR